MVALAQSCRPGLAADHAPGRRSDPAAAADPVGAARRRCQEAASGSRIAQGWRQPTPALTAQRERSGPS